MGGVVYDTGALLAAASGDGHMWRLHRGALERNEVPLVLTPVLARALGAARHAEPPGAARHAEPSGAAHHTELLGAFLRGCALADFPVAAAYDVGRLLARSGTSDLIAAAVVLAAVTTRSAVVTREPQPLRALAGVLGVDLALAVVPHPTEQTDR